MSDRQRGFTLIELLIVIAIIGVLVAVALPSFVRSRMLANEAAVKSELREMYSAQTAIHVDKGAYFAPVCLAVMAPCGSQPPGCPCIGDTPYLSPALAFALGPDKPRAGYVRQFTPAPAPGPNPGVPGFCYQARPTVFGQTGTRSFGIDARGFIGMSESAVDCCGAGFLVNPLCAPMD